MPLGRSGLGVKAPVVYLRRRWRSPTGRKEVTRWLGAVVWMATVGGAVRTAVAAGWLTVARAEVGDAVGDVLSGQITRELVSTVGGGLAFVMLVPSLVWAVDTVIRLRPWRPHSGAAPPGEPSAPLFALTQDWQTTTATAEIAAMRQAERREAKPPPAVPPLRLPPLTAPVAPSPRPARPEAPEAAEAAPAVSDSPAAAPVAPSPRPARPEAPEAAEAAPAVSEDPPAAPVARARTPSGKGAPLQPDGRIMFHLCGPNPFLSSASQEMLALILSEPGARIGLRDACAAVGVSPNAVRNRMRRLVKAQWLDKPGTGWWGWCKATATTDLEQFLGAVVTEDEARAARIAESIGEPLPTVVAGWLDDGDWRSRLRTFADDALAQAADTWPDNPAFPAAADRLYGDD